ncbi:MAG: phosphoribosyl-AMP cyclohydrolase [Candidatus Sulfotelmatobacter sp.]
MKGVLRQERSMKIDFDKMQGLVPAVVQDAASGELLMLGFLNKEALDATLRSGLVTFYSRTRQALWTKGETSGNYLQVVDAWTDCDRDTVLFKVRVLGEGKVCHTGTRSCFTEALPLGADTATLPARTRS